MTTTPSLAGKHNLVPLPFAAGALNGLSERMIERAQRMSSVSSA